MQCPPDLVDARAADRTHLNDAVGRKRAAPSRHLVPAPICFGYEARSGTSGDSPRRPVAAPCPRPGPLSGCRIAGSEQVSSEMQCGTICMARPRSARSATSMSFGSTADEPTHRRTESWRRPCRRWRRRSTVGEKPGQNASAQRRSPIRLGHRCDAPLAGDGDSRGGPAGRLGRVLDRRAVRA
jgi:hypothetical protein